MPTSMKIDFYTVEVPENSPPFESMVEADSKTPDNDSRTIEVRGHNVRLQRATTRRGVVEADMLRIQMSQLPSKAKLSGAVSSLNLDEDEGIGNETCFLYHPATKVMAIQRNKSGVTARMLAEYFQQKNGLTSPIELSSVIQKDALDRLSRMQETRKIRIRMAGVTNPDFFKGRADTAVGEMLNIMKFMDAPTANVELSMGRQPGSLSVARVVKMAREMLGMADRGDVGESSSMDVFGTFDDDTQERFDVLSYRMVEEVVIKEDRRRRAYASKSRRDELFRVWEKRKDELQSMFGDS